MEEQLLTAEDVAWMFRTSARFVRRLVVERQIAYIPMGRGVRFTSQAVADYVERCTVQPVSWDAPIEAMPSPGGRVLHLVASPIPPRGQPEDGEAAT